MTYTVRMCIYIHIYSYMYSLWRWSGSWPEFLRAGSSPRCSRSSRSPACRRPRRSPRRASSPASPSSPPSAGPSPSPSGPPDWTPDGPYLLCITKRCIREKNGMSNFPGCARRAYWHNAMLTARRFATAPSYSQEMPCAHISLSLSLSCVRLGGEEL